MASQEESARAYEYELGHSDRELKRLRLQAELIDPFTRQYYRDAGIEQGMRVLDVGSGGGDAALVAAELVGEKGQVVGVDIAAAAVAAAQARVDALGKRNISFHHGNLDRLEFAEKFDAAVGRYVLMFNPDPAEMVKKRCKARAVGRRHRVSRIGLEWVPFKPCGADVPAMPRLDRADVREGRDQSADGSPSTVGVSSVLGSPRRRWRSER